MATCGKCHRDAPDGALFCAFCGGPIVAAGAPGEPVDPYIGQTFKGMYFVQQKVGGGGMGQVYKAVHVTLDAPVALKILKKALLADPSVVQRFHREARAASRLRHPNVISVTDFGQGEDGTLFMAMEYVAGRSLARVIAEDFPVSEQRVVHIGAQILAALAEAHAAQILHRDLKPENVMIESRRDEADSVKVLDFGIAKIQLPGDGHGTLTQAGLVCGTPGYMSPEQWGAEGLDARSDLYSVGVILYEMLTGRLPFEAETPMEMVRKHLTETPRPPSERRPDGRVSPDLEALVMRALSASPDARPASAEEMRADLLTCVLDPEPEGRAASGPARTMVMPRRPVSSPPRARQSASRPPAPPAPSELEDQPTRMAPAVGARTNAFTDLPAVTTPVPARPARPPTPAASRRPPSGPGLDRRTPAPARPPAQVPRHEEDDAGSDADADAPSATVPAPSRRTALVAGAAASLVAVAVVLFLVLGRAPPALVVSGASPARLPVDGGTAVELTGSGFPDGVRVTLGGAAAPVSASTPTSVRITAPAHAAGPADVVVTAPDGRSATLPGGLVYAAPAPPPPRLEALSPATGAAGGGTAVTLTGAGFAPSARVAFDGVPAPVTSAGGGALVVTAPPHAPGDVDVEVRNPDGQRATLPGAFRYEAAARPSPPRRPEPPPPRAPGKVVSVSDALNAIPTPSAITGDGVLSVQVEPYGDVYLDDRPYGEAPREFRVTAGTYLVRVRNPALGQREQRLTVKAGQRTRWIPDLSRKP